MSILAYVICVPIAKELASRLNNPSISTATVLALGAVASFYLVYPFHIIISATGKLTANKDPLLLLGFLIAVSTSTAGSLYVRNLGKIGTYISSENGSLREAQPEFSRSGFTEIMGPIAGWFLSNLFMFP